MGRFRNRKIHQSRNPKIGDLRKLTDSKIWRRDVRISRLQPTFPVPLFRSAPCQNSNSSASGIPPYFSPMSNRHRRRTHRERIVAARININRSNGTPMKKTETFRKRLSAFLLVDLRRSFRHVGNLNPKNGEVGGEGGDTRFKVALGTPLSDLIKYLESIRDFLLSPFRPTVSTVLELPSVTMLRLSREPPPPSREKTKGKKERQSPYPN